MKKILFFIMVIGMLAIYSGTTQVINKSSTIVKADTLSDINATLNSIQLDLDQLIEHMQDVLVLVTNINASTSTSELSTILTNLQNAVDNLNHTSLGNVTTRLDQIDDDLIRVEQRLGYNTSLDPEKYNIYEDFNKLFQGLYWVDNTGHTHYLLKNDSGVPAITTIGDNQVAIYTAVTNGTQQTLNEIDDASSDINARTSSAVGSAKSDIGGMNTLVLVLLILVVFLVVYIIYLQPRYFPQGGKPGFTNEGYGRPSCFGNPDAMDMELNPLCRKCKFGNKCEASIIRSEGPPQPASGTGLEAKYNADGGIARIYDDGEQIETPSCFGEEFDDSNPDCRDCLINQLCAQELSKNSQRVRAPPMPLQQRINAPIATGRRGMAQPAGAGMQTEDILKDF